jgi:hypothetical protein
LNRLIQYTLEGIDNYERVPSGSDQRISSLSRFVSVVPVTAILLLVLLSWPVPLMMWLNGPLVAAEVIYVVLIAIVLKIL